MIRVSLPAHLRVLIGQEEDLSLTVAPHSKAFWTVPSVLPVSAIRIRSAFFAESQNL